MLQAIRYTPLKGRLHLSSYKRDHRWLRVCIIMLLT